MIEKVHSSWFIVHSILFVLTLCAVVYAPQPAYAQAVSSVELINKPKQYDGKVSLFEGEAIGEIMRRGEYAWVNVYDGNRAIGIWMPYELSRDIEYTGGHKSRGDIVAITGVFHQNCLEHGGDTDIHAEAMRKIRPGRVVSERLNFAKRNQAIVLGALCLLIWILTLFLRS